MNSGTARTPRLAWARLSTAGTAPGSIIAAIITIHTPMKKANEPSRVATPMSIPCICRTASTQDAAASPSVPVSVAAATAGVARVATAGSAGAPMTPSSDIAIKRLLHYGNRLVASRGSGDSEPQPGTGSRPRWLAGCRSARSPLVLAGHAGRRTLRLLGDHCDELGRGGPAAGRAQR